MPSVRQGVAEGMEGPGGVGRKPFVRDEQHTGRAERQERRSRRHGTDPAGGGGIVARAARHHGSLRHAPLGAKLGPQPATHVGAFDESRHVRLVQSRCGQHLVGPSAARNVQPVGARRVGHVGHVVANQPQAHVIFGQQDLCDPGEDVRLMSPHPEQFWRREARHRDVSGDRARLLAQGLQLTRIRRRRGRRSTGWRGVAPDRRHRSAWRRAAGRTDRCR